MDRNNIEAYALYEDVVALRKESVDRNIVTRGLLQQLIESLSARRAWIEIFTAPLINNVQPRRSPQGERG